MKGSVFHTSRSTSSSDDCHLRYEALSVCVGGRVHICYTLERSCRCSADGTVRVIGSRVSFKNFIGRCDGHSCRRLPVEGNDAEACFERETYEDGDSGTRTCCYGGFHFQFKCGEFGSGWYRRGDPVPCDGSCRPREIRLPRSVASFVRRYGSEDPAAWPAFSRHG